MGTAILSFHRRGLIWRFVLALGLIASSAGVGAQESVEIFEIQGAGETSPLFGERVVTGPNVVTAVGRDLFFMQTPDERDDHDPATSNGIMVAAAVEPQLEIGDLVVVTGIVGEFYDLTRIHGTVEVERLGETTVLPTAVVFDADRPSPSSLPSSTQFEAWEGMAIAIDHGTVCAGSDRYGDVRIVARSGRSFREPGIEYPGLDDSRVWDGNPEVFELNPDAIAGDDLVLAGGTRFRARGVLSYSFGDYQLWPTSFEIIKEAEMPRPARHPRSTEILVAAQNFERLEADDSLRLRKASVQVREVLQAPDILALEEMIDLASLEALAAQITEDDPSIVYQPLLEAGNDFGGIDVAFLIRQRVMLRSLIQIGADAILEYDGTRLHDRPPLVLEASIDEIELTVVVVHLRSLNGIEDAGSGPRVRQKRLEQAEWIARWLNQRQLDNPSEKILVVGDFNAFEFSDGFVDVLGVITGNLSPDPALLPGEDLVDPDFVNLSWSVPAPDRYSYVYRGHAEVLDHAVVNQALLPMVRTVAFSRGNADVSESFEGSDESALRSSDHDAVLVYLDLPRGRRATGRHQP